MRFQPKVTLSLTLLLGAFLFEPQSFAVSGGVEATTRDLPFTARIGSVESLSSPYASIFDCTAQYVSENTLTTAAHCFGTKPSGWVSQGLARKTETRTANVYVAHRGRRLPIFVGGMNRFAVKAILIEKRYRDSELDNPSSINKNLEDKAIIIMDRNIRSRFIPISVNAPYVGQRVLMAGYGFTRFLAKNSRDAFEKLSVNAAGLHFGTNSISQRQRNGLVNAYYKWKKSSTDNAKGMPKKVFTTSKDDVAALEGDSGSALIGLDSMGRAVLLGIFSRTTVVEESNKTTKGSQYATFMSARDMQFLKDAEKFGGRVYFSDKKSGPNLKGLLKYISKEEFKKFKLK